VRINAGVFETCLLFSASLGAVFFAVRGRWLESVLASIVALVCGVVIVWQPPAK
jgi:hypothetical protein